jgi:hypothetical protein
MTIDQLIHVVVTVLLIEIKASVGLEVNFADPLAISGNWQFVRRAGLANYVCVPPAQSLPTGFSRFSGRCCRRWLGRHWEQRVATRG